MFYLSANQKVFIYKITAVNVLIQKIIFHMSSILTTTSSELKLFCTKIYIQLPSQRSNNFQIIIFFLLKIVKYSILNISLFESHNHVKFGKQNRQL